MSDNKWSISASGASGVSSLAGSSGEWKEPEQPASQVGNVEPVKEPTKEPEDSVGSVRRPKRVTVVDYPRYGVPGKKENNLNASTVSRRMKWTEENYKLAPYSKEWLPKLNLLMREIIDNENPFHPLEATDIQNELTYFYGIRGATLRIVNDFLDSMGTVEQRKAGYWEFIKQQTDQLEIQMLESSQLTDEELHDLPQTNYDLLSQHENLYHMLERIVRQQITTFEAGTVIGYSKRADVVKILNLGCREGFLSRRGNQYTLKEKGKAFINHSKSNG